MDLFDVRFDKLQEFIQVVRCGGQDICGVVIFCFVNCFVYVISDDCVMVSQFFQVILNVVDVQWVIFQWGFVVDNLSGFQSYIVQLYCMFCYGIQMIDQCGVEVIQYFMYGNEVSVVYVLVCLFGN